MKRFLLFFVALMTLPLFSSNAQTVGLKKHVIGSLDDGYVLFAPIGSNTTYLIDKCGKMVHSWPSKYSPGLSVYLLGDGTLLRTGVAYQNDTFQIGAGAGGMIEKIDWDGNVIWSYRLCDSVQCQHHDIEPMPNGHILAVVWDKKNPAQAKAAGRKLAGLPSPVWSEKVVELEPTGTNGANVVWEWSAWDHLIQNYDPKASNYDAVGNNPGLIDVNYQNNGVADWLHMNSVKYNADLDQIVVCIHNWSEIWILDHNSNTAKYPASITKGHVGGKQGHGGDILYRWGNPASYQRGKITDQKFFHPHDPYWIPKGLPNAGKIMIFNNGLDRPDGQYSSVEIIAPPVNLSGAYNSLVLPYGPTKLTWSYTAPVKTDFYSAIISGEQMLDEGNVLICSGTPGELFEIDNTKQVVWDYISPISNTGPVSQGANGGFPVFRCTYFPKTFSGFTGHQLTAEEPLELNPTAYDCKLDSFAKVHTNGVSLSYNKDYFNVVNPFGDKIVLKSNRVNPDVSISLYDAVGRKVQNWTNQHVNDGESLYLDVDHGLKTGIYFLNIKGYGFQYSTKLVKE